MQKFINGAQKNKETRKSRRYAENPRDTAVFRGQRPPGLLFQKNRFQKWSRRVCVPNFRSVPFFLLWPKGAVQTNRHPNLQVKIGGDDQNYWYRHSSANTQNSSTFGVKKPLLKKLLPPEKLCTDRYKAPPLSKVRF